MQTIKTIWVNGCFDVLHRGHLELFKFAKSQGDCLIVGIDSDFRVKKNKGKDRPFNNEKDRKFFLECIKYIDRVVIFNTDKELKTILKINNIDCLIVGSDWKGKTVIGADLVKEVKYFKRIGEYSTTNILERK